MPRGAWSWSDILAQYLPAIFGQKQNFAVYFSVKRRSLLHPNTAQRSFLPITIFFLEELNEKLARKARVNTERVYWIVLMPPWHPIILLKSNKFTIVAVSVKRSIMGFRCTWWRSLGTQLKLLPRRETALIGGPVLTWVWITPMQRPNHSQRRSQSFPTVREAMWSLTSQAQWGNGEVVSPIMGCLFAQLTSWKMEEGLDLPAVTCQIPPGVLMPSYCVHRVNKLITLTGEPLSVFFH